MRQPQGIPSTRSLQKRIPNIIITRSSMNQNSAQPAKNSPSRRRFLQTSAASGATFFAVSQLLAADGETKTEPVKPKSDPPKSDPTKINPAAASTAANSRINVALIGAGGQGRGDMQGLIFGCKQNVVAICDPDPRQIEQARKDGKKATAHAAAYTDYRDLLEDADTIDAVLIATPDHWHAPLCKAFIKAGKHVYCEKPLTRTLGEARELRELVRANRNIVTQMGNQGSAEQSLRRSVELIRAGVLGQVTEVHSWLNDVGRGADRSPGEDPVPTGFSWDYWCGPSPYRPYKAGAYHPAAWRAWFDFGGGPLADFTCHIYNTALRSLDLSYATKVEVQGEGLAKESFAKSSHLQMHFAGRKQIDSDRQLEPVTLHWYNGGLRPSDEQLKDVLIANPKVQNGCLIVGEKGIIWCNPWNNDARIKLHDDDKLRGVSDHAPTKEIPKTLPRSPGHMQEWINAIINKTQPWSEFDFGGHLTEIGLTGVLGVRLGHDFEWDGEAQVVKGMPEAKPLIKPVYRKSYVA
jgi:predicted dehydrogenase